MDINKSKWSWLIPEIKEIRKQDPKIGYRNTSKILFDNHKGEEDFTLKKPKSLYEFVRNVLKSLTEEQQKNETEWVAPKKTSATLDDSGNMQISGQGKTLDELLEDVGVSLKDWEIMDLKVRQSEWDVASKYRDQDLNWTVIDGQQFMEGHAKRENKWMTHTNKLYSFQIRLKPRFGILDSARFKREFIEDLKAEAPQIKLIDRQYTSGVGYALEVNIFDAHLGRFIWNEVASELVESTHKTEERFRQAIQKLVADAQTYVEGMGGYIEQISFPIGNDFFTTDKDYPFPQTTKATPQLMDMNWQHVYRRGRKLIQWSIDYLKEVAPVYVPVIQGNHDWQKAFYLGDAMEIAYENDDNVDVENSSEVGGMRKYFRFGQNLIGYTHGKWERNRLYTLMQLDRKHDWADTKFREWHIGDHHKAETFLIEIDYQGILIKHLRAFTHVDDWEDQMGFYRIIGAEAYLWHPSEGKKAIFYDNYSDAAR